MKNLFFFPWNFVRQYSNLQNDILDLHVALAKKIVHMFEKSMKNPQRLGFSLIFRVFHRFFKPVYNFFSLMLHANLVCHFEG